MADPRGRRPPPLPSCRDTTHTYSFHTHTHTHAHTHTPTDDQDHDPVQWLGCGSAADPGPTLFYLHHDEERLAATRDGLALPLGGKNDQVGGRVGCLPPGCCGDRVLMGAPPLSPSVLAHTHARTHTHTLSLSQISAVWMGHEATKGLWRVYSPMVQKLLDDSISLTRWHPLQLDRRCRRSCDSYAKAQSVHRAREGANGE